MPDMNQNEKSGLKIGNMVQAASASCRDAYLPTVMVVWAAAAVRIGGEWQTAPGWRESQSKLHTTPPKIVFSRVKTTQPQPLSFDFFFLFLRLTNLSVFVFLDPSSTPWYFQNLRPG